MVVSLFILNIEYSHGTEWETKACISQPLPDESQSLRAVWRTDDR